MPSSRLLRPGLMAALCCAISGPALAQPVSYELDPAQTRVHFEVLHFGTSTVRGRFDAVSGSIELDRSQGRGRVAIVIDTASVSTGLPTFDATIRGPSLLDAAAYPQAYFVAEQCSYRADQLESMRGEFTLHGHSQALSLHALRFTCAPDPSTGRERCGGDFGISYALPFVADRVRLLIQVEALRP